LENWKALVADRSATEANFIGLRDKLLPTLGDQAEVVSDGTRLVDPVKLYSGERLSFQVAGIGDVDISGVDVVRCLNVLIYFDSTFRSIALEWFSRILREGGLLLIGFDWVHTTDARYTIYQKSDGRLLEREFAFSLDNLCAFVISPWFALSDDDKEVMQLAGLLGELRSDGDFLRQFYELSDALRSEFGICPRGTNGYHGDLDRSLSGAQL
jgi:hypothetical protein